MTPEIRTFTQIKRDAKSIPFLIVNCLSLFTGLAQASHQAIGRTLDVVGQKFNGFINIACFAGLKNLMMFAFSPVSCPGKRKLCLGKAHSVVADWMHDTAGRGIRG